MSLFDLACQQRWAMTEDGLRGILALVNRESLDPDLARQIREDRAARPSALAAQAGRPLDGARSVRVRDGVAIVEVVGPIVRRADMFSDISGATSAEWLSRDFATAMRDPAVESILLVFDTPGGEVTGINELAQMIMAARAQKPVWAYVEGLGASAGYWLASAAEQVVIDDTALLGSIGVVMAVPDPTKRTSKEIEIVSSQSPNKRPDVGTERGRALLQTLVDDTAAVFVAAVAKQRGVSEQTVISQFGQGGVLVGKVAVVAGLADRLGSFETTLADLRQTALKRKRPRMMGANGDTNMDKGFWANFFGGMFGAAAEAEGTPIAAALEQAATPLIAQPTTVAAAAVADPRDAELQALRERIARQEQAALAVKAEAFADGAIRAHQALPAERTQLIALYTQSAATEAGTATLEALIAARPPHTLAAEQVAVGAGGVLESGALQAVTPERRSKLLGMTPLGQAAAKRARSA